MKDTAWYLKQRETEKFVRYTGKVFTMGKYQVFNPLTGLHTYCETEELAKAAIAEISKQILETHKISVCREFSNEHGHTTWVAEQIVDPITISPNI
jgi:hypothetical protein